MDSNSTCLICPFKPRNLHIPFSSHLGKMNLPPFNLHKWFASRLGGDVYLKLVYCPLIDYTYRPTFK